MLISASLDRALEDVLSSRALFILTKLVKINIKI
jgi:hypothetical protein